MWFSAFLFTLLFVILVSSSCVSFILSLLQNALLILCTSLFFLVLIYALLCGLCRPSGWALLSLGGSLPQRNASSRWPVCQNQRCVGNPAGVTAAHQAAWERAVWGGLDGYGSSRLQKKRPHGRDHTESAETSDNLAWERHGSNEMGNYILIIIRGFAR